MSYYHKSASLCLVVWAKKTPNLQSWEGFSAIWQNNVVPPIPALLGTGRQWWLCWQQAQGGEVLGVRVLPLPRVTGSPFPSTSSPLCLTESQSKWGKQGEVSAHAAVFWDVLGPQGWLLKGPSQKILFLPVLLLTCFGVGPHFQAVLRGALQSN